MCSAVDVKGGIRLPTSTRLARHVHLAGYAKATRQIRLRLPIEPPGYQTCSNRVARTLAGHVRHHLHCRADRCHGADGLGRMILGCNRSTTRLHCGYG